MSDPFVSVGVVEALRAHPTFVDKCKTGQWQGSYFAMCVECAWETPYIGDEAECYRLAADHQGEAVVAAIRSMSVQQQAELIGGTVDNASIGYPCERVVTDWRVAS